MTNDPIIAEIDAANATHYAGFAPAHLSDAPKVEDLLKAAKEEIGNACLDWWERQQGADGPRKSLSLALQRGEAMPVEYRWTRSLFAAIRAIEPEWTP